MAPSRGDAVLQWSGWHRPWAPKETAGPYTWLGGGRNWEEGEGLAWVPEPYPEKPSSLSDPEGPLRPDRWTEGGQAGESSQRKPKVRTL